MWPSCWQLRSLNDLNYSPVFLKRQSLPTSSSPICPFTWCLLLRITKLPDRIFFKHLSCIDARLLPRHTPSPIKCSFQPNLHISEREPITSFCSLRFLNWKYHSFRNPVWSGLSNLYSYQLYALANRLSKYMFVEVIFSGPGFLFRVIWFISFEACSCLSYRFSQSVLSYVM